MTLVWWLADFEDDLTIFLCVWRIFLVSSIVWGCWFFPMGICWAESGFLFALDCAKTTLVWWLEGFELLWPFWLRIFLISSTMWGYWFVPMDACWAKVLSNPSYQFLSDPLSKRAAITSFFTIYSHVLISSWIAASMVLWYIFSSFFFIKHGNFSRVHASKSLINSTLALNFKYSLLVISGFW